MTLSPSYEDLHASAANQGNFLNLRGMNYRNLYAAFFLAS